MPDQIESPNQQRRALGDFCDAFAWHRSCTSAETAANGLLRVDGDRRVAIENAAPGGSGLNKKNGLYYPNGAQNLSLVVYGVRTSGDAAALTCNLTVIAWPKRPAYQADGITRFPMFRAPRGWFHLTLAVTFGTSRQGEIHPFDCSDESGVLWCAASTLSVTLGTGSAPQTSSTVFDGGGDNRVAAVDFDARGADALWVAGDTFGSNLSRIDVGIRQLG